jgi:L-aspartate oxidase
VLHARDATGAEIERALVAAVKADARIEIIEHALVLDLVPARTADGRPGVAGATLHVMGEGTRGGVGAVQARAVVLASGGIGQIYAATTNPPVSTGDGVAAALRAGAELRDVEFIQFHPTVLYLGPGARGQLPLVSEAVRGEGAHLLNAAGERFMVGQHELAELAPRDVVAKAIMKQLMLDGSDHVYVDGRMLGEETWRVRFPTILHSCRRVGINPVTDLIPVAPASHYFCGGVRTDLDGQTSLARLYAVGEVASTGVHGANRLASNSLLEGLVYARRIAAHLRARFAAGECTAPLPALVDERPDGLIARSAMLPLQQLMSRYAGGLRSADGLRRCAEGLAALTGDEPDEPALETWEASNLMAVATAVVAAARFREESRGAHWREDHPDPEPAWLGHQLLVRASDGLAHRLVPVSAPVAAGMA